MYRALRDLDPVHRVVPRDRPDDDYYVLSRHADIWAAARDHDTFSSAHGLTVNYGELELLGLQHNPPMVMTDPPVHTEFRKLVSRGFTPRQVQAVEPKVREFVVERITWACRNKIAPNSTAGPRRSSRPTPPRAASRRPVRRSGR
jgi:cytochrome P450